MLRRAWYECHRQYDTYPRSVMCSGPTNLGLCLLVRRAHDWLELASMDPDADLDADADRVSRRTLDAGLIQY